jgi:hypothetical protein
VGEAQEEGARPAGMHRVFEMSNTPRDMEPGAVVMIKDAEIQNFHVFCQEPKRYHES